MDSKGKGIHNALITTHPASSPKFTDKRGYFMLCFRRVPTIHHQTDILRKRLAPGPYKLTALRVGYTLGHVQFTFKSLTMKLPDIRLKRLTTPMCMSQRTTIRNGKKEGRERLCWPNGTLHLERHYRNGRLHGPYRVMTLHGLPYETGHFHNGKLHGTYTRWTPKQAAVRSRYRHGIRITSNSKQPTPPTKANATKPTKGKTPWFPPLISSWNAFQQRRIFQAIRKDKGASKFISQPWFARIRANRDQETQTRLFHVPKGEWGTLRILAFGEAQHGRMVDTAWISHRQTGRIMWSMTLKNTRPNGTDPRHRLFDRVLKLPAGDYVCHYRTNATHSPEQWITSQPPHHKRYGVTLYNIYSKGYYWLKRKK